VYYVSIILPQNMLIYGRVFLTARQKPFRTQDVDEPESKAKEVAVMGKEILAQVQADMAHTTISSWVKAPPKNFGTSSHGTIGAEEYKSLALISLTFSLVRLWSQADQGFCERLNQFIHLTLAIRVLAYQSITHTDISTIAHHYALYVSGLKTLYPHYSITPVQPLGLHVPEFLSRLGPATRFNENPCKMFIGMLQDITINWKLSEFLLCLDISRAIHSDERAGKLETTLHKELILVSNLQALLLEPSISTALGEVGSVTQDFLASRFPGTSELLCDSWVPTANSANPVPLGDELYDCILRAFLLCQKPKPARHQLPCSKIQYGHLIYQPRSFSAGNSNIVFEYPGIQNRLFAGQIKSIFLTPSNANCGPGIILVVRMTNIMYLLLRASLFCLWAWYVFLLVSCRVSH
jgi:hypothetical protein